MNYPEIIYEDGDIVVINKPAAWVAHEGAGETGETISDWFVKNYPEVMTYTWEDLRRVGIVHRLDKDTSGVMLLAKSPEILADLQQQFKDRTTQKEYVALVLGIPKDKQGVIETFVGRHPKRRQEQAVLPIQVGEAARREAITEYKVDETYLYKTEPISLISFWPRTGRMHQLRVHAKWLETPILGDQTYTTKPAKRLSKELKLTRQLLHARSLSFRHPTTHKRVTFEAKLPPDIETLIKHLKK